MDTFNYTYITNRDVTNGRFTDLLDRIAELSHNGVQVGAIPSSINLNPGDSLLKAITVQGKLTKAIELKFDHYYRWPATKFISSYPDEILIDKGETITLIWKSSSLSEKWEEWEKMFIHNQMIDSELFRVENDYNLRATKKRVLEEVLEEADLNLAEMIDDVNKRRKLLRGFYQKDYFALGNKEVIGELNSFNIISLTDKQKAFEEDFADLDDDTIDETISQDSKLSIRTLTHRTTVLQYMLRNLHETYACLHKYSNEHSRMMISDVLEEFQKEKIDNV